MTKPRLALAAVAIAALTLLATDLAAQTPDRPGRPTDPLTAAYPPDVCPSCAAWNAPVEPFRIHGDAYYVGTRGLGAILITSPEGHILIDGGLPNSAPRIGENIEALGFDIADVRLILNSRVHYDHADGIAALRRASGARVMASERSAPVLEAGRVGRDDPQYGLAFDFPAVSGVERFDDGATLRVGPLAVTAHRTAGHTPGGTTWSRESCEGDRCLSDVLITTHPGASSLWDRFEAGAAGLVDPDACRAYAERSRRRLDERLRPEG